MATQQKVSKKLNKRWIGSTQEILVEGQDSKDVYFGRFYGQAPEVDGKVYFFSNKKLSQGEFVDVDIKKAYNYDLLGEYHELSK